MGAKVLNPKPAFLSEKGDVYLLQKDGSPWYFDEQHLTTKGALATILPFLESRVIIARLRNANDDQNREIVSIRNWK